MLAPRYSQTRLFIILLALAVLAGVVLWDSRIALADMQDMLAQWAERIGADSEGWLASLAARTLANPLTLAMIVFLVILFIYFLVQYVALRLERRTIFKSHKPSAATRAWLYLAGRSPAFLAQLPQSARLAQHYHVGREALLAPLRLALWAYPMVGFLGTVVGISQSVAVLPRVLEDSQQLNQLLSSLYVAFDTTFAGLVGSLLMMLLVHALESAWDYNAALAGHYAEA